MVEEHAEDPLAMLNLIRDNHDRIHYADDDHGEVFIRFVMTRMLKTMMPNKIIVLQESCPTHYTSLPPSR